ncbi:Photosystem II reaction center protein K [Bienertia sinuspersici]
MLNIFSLICLNSVLYSVVFSSLNYRRPTLF